MAFLLFGVFLLGGQTGTQNIGFTMGEICLVGVTGNPGSLTVSAPAVGGSDPVSPTDSSTYAQYTSTVSSGLTRVLTAELDPLSDSAPPGCSLKLTATPSGGANEGTSSGQITLTTNPQNIITGIGGCATGTGATDGAQLTYVLSVDSITSLVADPASSVASIILTLEDAS